MNYEDMSDFEIEVEVIKVLFPFVLGDGYEFIGSRDGFIYTKEDRKEHKLSGNRLICTIKNYCNNPSDAWPIINSSRIEIKRDTCQAHVSSYFNPTFVISCRNDEKEVLRAAMICFLKMKDAEK